LKRHDDAIAAFDRALKLDPNLAAAWLDYGNVLFELKRDEQALAAYDKALSFEPSSAKARVGRGNIFADLRRYDDAFAAYDAALSLDPDLPALEGERLHCRMHLCEWSHFETECDHLVRSVRNGKENTSPFAFLAISSSSRDQFDYAQLWTRKCCPATAKSSWRGERYRHDRIRIGYLSSDFRQTSRGGSRRRGF
jgi:protein O-GlcNAc transferase